MQFREVRNKIQILETQYVPAVRDKNGNLLKGTGRTKTMMLGSFDSNISSVHKIDRLLLDKLGIVGKKELTAYFKKFKKEKQVKNIKSSSKEVIRHLKIIAANYDIALFSDDDIKNIDALVSDIKAERRKAKRRIKKD